MGCGRQLAMALLFSVEIDDDLVEAAAGKAARDFRSRTCSPCSKEV